MNAEAELLPGAAAEIARCDRRAGRWQRIHFAGRMAVLVLGLAAALATVGRDLLDGPAYPLRFWLDRAAVVLPFVAAALVVLLSLLRPARRWVAWRAATEVYKSETFLYATRAGEYAGPDRDAVYRRQRSAVDRLVRELLRPPRSEPTDRPETEESAAPWRDPVSPPQGPIGPEDYLRERLDHQRQWYRRRARRHERRHAVLMVLLSMANLGAGAAALLSCEAWLPVLTTLAGTLATWSALRAGDYLAAGYRSTAAQLDLLAAAWRLGRYGSDPSAFGRFVLDVERTLAREHGSWVLEMTLVAQREE